MRRTAATTKAELEYDNVLSCGPPLLPISVPAYLRNRSVSAAPSAVAAASSKTPAGGPRTSDPFSRIVGTESELSLNEIRRQNEVRAQTDSTNAQHPSHLQAVEDPPIMSLSESQVPSVAGENRSVKVLVASTDIDESQTYIEAVSLGQGRPSWMVAVLPGKRDIVHASVSSVGPSGEVLVLFTERELAAVANQSMLDDAEQKAHKYQYRLYICAAKAPPELAPHGGGGGGSSTGTSSRMDATSTAAANNSGGSTATVAPPRPLCILDITPDGPHSVQGNGKPAYHVGYFIKSDDKKSLLQSFILASDNTDVGLCLRQAHFLSKGKQNTIRITMHEKWSLAKNQFWHQWDPHRQQIVFAVHCVQFIKFRMIALDGSPDRRLPLFERNVKPQSLPIHHGAPLDAPFASGNSSPNTAVHFTVLPIRYECGTEDYALCSQVVKKGRFVRHTMFTSQVVVTVTLLRNQLKEGRAFLEVPFRVKSKSKQLIEAETSRRRQRISLKVFASDTSRLLGDEGLPSPRLAPVVSSRQNSAYAQEYVDDRHLTTLPDFGMLGGPAAASVSFPPGVGGSAAAAAATAASGAAAHPPPFFADEAEGGTAEEYDKDEEFRVTFCYLRGLIAVVFPHGHVHFIDVAHKEQCPTYLFGSRDWSLQGADGLGGGYRGEEHRADPSDVDNFSMWSDDVPLPPPTGAGATATGGAAAASLSGLSCLVQALQYMKRRNGPVVLSTLPTPAANIIFVSGTTVASSIDLNPHGIWMFMKRTLNRKHEIINYLPLLHTAVHTVTTHIPPRLDGYALNYLKTLLLDSASSSLPANSSKRAVDARRNNTASKQCIISADIIAELLLGECYTRVRARSRASSSLLHLILPMSDDAGYMERQEELFASLRFTTVAAKITYQARKARFHAKLRHLESSLAHPEQPDPFGPSSPGGGGTGGGGTTTKGELPTSDGSPSPARGGHVDPGSPSTDTGAVSTTSSTTATPATPLLLNPQYRFHHMLFHDHNRPPIPEHGGRGEEQMERPYSYSTACTPSAKDVREECSLTSERWWTRHVITAPSTGGFFDKLLRKTRDIVIQRISFRQCARTADLPFDRYMQTLLTWRDVPAADAQTLVSRYIEEMSTLIEDIIEIISQPPEIIHPHTQILFLINLCAALEYLQFPWKGPLRARVSKLILQHVPATVVTTGIKSHIIPAELDEVLLAFKNFESRSVWVQHLVLNAAGAARSYAGTRQRTTSSSRAPAPPAAEASSSDDSTCDGDEDETAVPKKTPTAAFLAPHRTESQAARRTFASYHRGRGFMHCAGTVREQKRLAFGNMVSCSSLYTHSTTAFDDFDKQLVLVEMFPHSTMQFHRNQLPLDGFVPNYQPLRSFVNWRTVVDSETLEGRRLQPPLHSIATTRDIHKPPKRSPAPEKDMAEHKRRMVSDALVFLTHPFQLINAPH